jgi:hypothetical protein
MSRKSLLWCLSLVLFISLHGCTGIVIGGETIRGSGDLSEETYAFTGITGVQLSTTGELDIQLGDKEELRIETDDNLLQYFEAEQDGGTLRIGTRRGFNLRPSGTVRYTLTVKELEFLGLSSSGNAHAPALSADRFEIRISSSGNVSVDGIDAGSLDVRISSSGDVSVDGIDAGSLNVSISSSGTVEIGEGVVDTQEIRISSSGNYRGESVRSGRATVTVSSSGDARLWVEESLDANLSSSGSVYYKGDPEVSDSHSSSGRVERIR